MKRRKKHEVLRYVFLWAMLAAVVLWIWKADSGEAMPAVSPEPSPVPSAPAEEERERQEEDLVGLWVPYYELAAEDEENFKENFEATLHEAETAGVNALFVHVRAFCDALYRSDIYPTSHLLGGVQGGEYSFDPLAYMVEAAHSRGMELHAWINPLRVRNTTAPEGFGTDSIYAALHDSCPYYFIETDSGIYLDPAYSHVRELVARGAGEIAENYHVDGIHFDDYFYPADMGDQDAEAYSAYLEMAVVPLSVEQWRMANINTMVSEVYRAVKRADPRISFGISPQGNMENNPTLGADVRAWCSTPGYIDYICPQIYFSFGNEALNFGEALESWSSVEKHEGLEMYVGLALYKVGTDSDGGTWSEDSSEIQRQREEVKRAKADGIVYFDSSELHKLVD